MLCRMQVRVAHSRVADVRSLKDKVLKSLIIEELDIIFSFKRFVNKSNNRESILFFQKRELVFPKHFPGIAHVYLILSSCFCLLYGILEE